MRKTGGGRGKIHLTFMFWRKGGKSGGKERKMEVKWRDEK